MMADDKCTSCRWSAIQMHLFGGQPEERCAHPETELAEPAATGGPMASFPLMRVARGRQGLCGPKARLRERKA